MTIFSQTNCNEMSKFEVCITRKENIKSSKEIFECIPCVTKLDKIHFSEFTCVNSVCFIDLSAIGAAIDGYSIVRG
jgi:hypothetical protein